jgi:hypothetical protein
MSDREKDYMEDFAQEAARRLRAQPETPPTHCARCLQDIERIDREMPTPPPTWKPRSAFKCEDCGLGVMVDEDECCATCGADTTVVNAEVAYREADHE